MTAGNQPSSSGSAEVLSSPDIVERLRELHNDMRLSIGGIASEAAGEIERLRAQSWKYLQEVGVQARRCDGLAQASRTPLDLSAGELNTLATDAFREGAQASLTPGVMNRTTVSSTGKDITIACNDYETHDEIMDSLINNAYAITPSPGARAWTAADQFWEYVGGLAGEFEAGQMRDMLAAKGLSISSTQREGGK